MSKRTSRRRRDPAAAERAGADVARYLEMESAEASAERRKAYYAGAELRAEADELMEELGID
jgi:hypothetical protein